MVSSAPSHAQSRVESGDGSGTRRPRVRRRTAVGTAMGASALLAWALVGQSPAYAADAPVGLGTAGTYSVLGGETVTNTGPTTLAGDLGVNAGSAITGFPPGHAAGATHAGDAQAGLAQSDLATAYDDAAGRAMTAGVAGDLVGQTLAPGVYKSSGPLAVSGALTLDGRGNPNSVFIFQVASDLTTASASNIVLTNSAQACNIYWQVGTSATLGTNSTFNGNILALTSITATNGTTVHGRALARNGQVTLDTNVFTMPGCATASPTPTATAPSTPTGPAAAASPTPAPASAGTGTGRGVNIDTAADNRASHTGTALGAAAAAAGLIGVWMLTGGMRQSRRNK
ncbi:ice-binding family protein [Arthrobacter sp. U41]|uniref:ice-binding family protein n=1 Tax=Arthrobacter sp. U41 TaxID=1849032 RepID=UPI0009F332AD|nr:ice-binding family protein [Arthrobacter sp. U41]